MAVITSTEPPRARIEYLARDEQHETVKPYYLYMNYKSDIAPTNTAPDDRMVQIYNARELNISPKDMFFEWGFAKFPFECSLTAEQYWDRSKVQKVLYPQYKSMAQQLFPDAARIEVLEHSVRKRHPGWMKEKLERHELSTNQPSDYVHIDMTASSALKCSIKQFDIDPRQYSRFVVVNLWKPIKGPVYDFPLTLCDRRTVDFASQATAMDIVTHNYANENTRIYFDESHKWYYWHGLGVNEIIAFVQADSNAENRGGVPHTAFQDPRAANNEQLRESIEARVFIFFD